MNREEIKEMVIEEIKDYLTINPKYNGIAKIVREVLKEDDLFSGWTSDERDRYAKNPADFPALWDNEDKTNKEEIKEMVKECLIEMKFPGIYMDSTDGDCEEDKKEFPQDGDTVYMLGIDGGYEICVINEFSKPLDYYKNAIGYGNGFKTMQEAEAVRDLRKHEAKCRFKMEDFEEGEWQILNDLNVFEINSHNVTLPEIMQGRVFPTKELAQERATILKRLAKIRGLI